jgi:hypothetical protein
MNSSLFQTTFPALTPKENPMTGLNLCEYSHSTSPVSNKN